MKRQIYKLIINFKLKKKGSKTRSFIHPRVNIGESVVLEKNIKIGEYLKELGDGTYICQDCFINYCEKIGKFCSIARNVSIGPGSHPIDMVSTSPIFYSKSRGITHKNLYDYSKSDKPVTIGNDVWIGTGAIILNGVKIGDGAVIGAGSVVTKDVSPYTIVGGVPARQIKKRFDDETIEKILNYSIYDKSFSEISSYAQLFLDINKFIENIESNEININKKYTVDISRNDVIR